MLADVEKWKKIKIKEFEEVLEKRDLFELIAWFEISKREVLDTVVLPIALKSLKGDVNG